MSNHCQISSGPRIPESKFSWRNLYAWLYKATVSPLKRDFYYLLFIYILSTYFRKSFFQNGILGAELLDIRQNHLQNMNKKLEKIFSVTDNREWWEWSFQLKKKQYAKLFFLECSYVQLLLVSVRLLFFSICLEVPHLTNEHRTHHCTTTWRGQLCILPV